MQNKSNFASAVDTSGGAHFGNFLSSLFRLFLDRESGENQGACRRKREQQGYLQQEFSHFLLGYVAFEIVLHKSDLRFPEMITHVFRLFDDDA